MNLQVNLILDSERRSASFVRFKTLGLTASVTVAVLLGISLLWKYVGYLEVARELERLEPQRAQFEQRQKETESLRKVLDVYRGYANEIMGWHYSRLPWSEILAGLQGQVPPTVQFRTLQMRTQLLIGKDGFFVRDHTVTLNGRHQGLSAETFVEAVRRAWTTQAPMSMWVEEAAVSSFGDDDTPGASLQDRLFQIEVKFHPRSSRAPAGQ